MLRIFYKDLLFITGGKKGRQSGGRSAGISGNQTEQLQ